MFRAVFGLMLTGSTLLAQTDNPEAVAQAKLGVSQAQKAHYREAVQSYQRAIAIDPNLPGIYLNLGLAWFKLGNFREAIAAFEKESVKAPDERVSTLLAMSYFGLGQYREAAERLKPLAAAQPGNAELSYLLAKCYLWSGQYHEAMDLFKGLLNRDPNSVAVHMLLGEALDASYRTSDATAEFEAAAKAGPTQPDVHFGLGYLYWKQKRYEDAEREFHEELKNNPKNARAVAYLGDVMMKDGRRQEALALLKAAVQLRSDLQVPHLDMGILYAESHRHDAAIAEFQRAIKIDPAGFDAHYRLARLYRELGRTADAEGEFRVVQKLHEKKTEEPLMKISGPQ
jgi:tetratricopeptide (TPR) repeat protein